MKEKDFIIENGVLKEYKGSSKNIIIPSNVKIIDARVFYLKKVESVIIPESVELIKYGAFENCKLKELKLPPSIKEIEYDAFRNNGLTKIELNEGLTKIGQGAFSNNNLTSITTPTTIKEIGYAAFHMNKLTYVKFSNSKVPLNIDRYAFNRNKINKLIIYENVYNIGNEAFSYNNIEYLEIHSKKFNLIKMIISSLQENTDIKEIKIIGYKINLLEKIEILNILRKNKVHNIGKIKITNTESPSIEENIPSFESIKDEEITKLLNEIQELIKLLNINNQVDIQNKVNTLIIEYKSKLTNIKPDLSFNNNTILNINENPDSLRNNLIFNLNRIKETINSQNYLLNFLTKLQKYQEIKEENSEILQDNEETIEYKIEYIKQTSKIYNNKNILMELNDIINNTKEQISNIVSKPILNEINLTLETKENIEKEYEEKIDILYNKTKKYNYIKELLKGSTEYTLSKDIKNLLFILNTLDDVEKEKYTTRLNEITNNFTLEDINTKTLEEITLIVRKKLQPLLETLSPIVSNKDIINDINSYLSSKELSSTRVIHKVILEIEEILNNSNLSIEDINKVKKEINETLISWKIKIENNELEENTNKNLKDDTILQINIAKDLYNIKYNLEQYIKEINDYDNMMKNI